MTDLGTRGSDNSSIATGINNSGQVVGWSYQASISNPEIEEGGLSHAVLWQDGGIANLGFLSGDNVSRALNINNLGQVFGESYQVPNNTPSTKHIFRWQNGAMTNLGTLVPPNGYTDSLINGINYKGQVVGSLISTSGDGNTVFAAFVWQKGTLTNLGNLGGTYTEAFDINVLGTVVGSSSTSSGTSHGFVWRNGKMRDLNTMLLSGSGWELEFAGGINNKGQIIGRGKFNGQDRGFLLTPVLVSN
jgi:probable HAF family extracellular repeat protein